MQWFQVPSKIYFENAIPVNTFKHVKILNALWLFWTKSIEKRVLIQRIDQLNKQQPCNYPEIFLNVEPDEYHNAQ